MLFLLLLKPNSFLNISYILFNNTVTPPTILTIAPKRTGYRLYDFHRFQSHIDWHGMPVWDDGFLPSGGLELHLGVAHPLCVYAYHSYFSYMHKATELEFVNLARCRRLIYLLPASHIYTVRTTAIPVAAIKLNI